MGLVMEDRSSSFAKVFHYKHKLATVNLSKAPHQNLGMIDFPKFFPPEFCAIW